MGRLAVVVPVLAFLLVSCAEKDAPADIVPRQGNSVATAPEGETAAAVRLARAPAATAAAGTAHTTIIATVGSLPGRSEPLTFRGEGEIDFLAGESRSILDLSDAMGMALTRGTELETISSDGLVYVRAPMLTSFSGASAPWVRIDPMATAQPGADALGLAPLTGLAGSDVGAPIALLNGVDVSSVRELRQSGRADGGTTTLRAMVDLSAAASAGATPHDLAALQRFLDRLGARRLEVEVELDEADRLRRLVYEHAVPTPTGTVSQHFEIRYQDFGAAVDIERPVDAEVRDLLAR
ncbi:MAG TPA: hypothetical protein VGV93_09800 [Acidimicrobiales bacterium]|nr:hypothetical protein [Acidimicrobiales bacterium]